MEINYGGYAKKEKERLGRLSDLELTSSLEALFASHMPIPGELSEEDARRAGIEILEADVGSVFCGTKEAESSLQFLCPHCKKIHRHGPASGMKVSHCTIPEAFRYNSYYLKPITEKQLMERDNKILATLVRNGGYLTLAKLRRKSGLPRYQVLISIDRLEKCHKIILKSAHRIKPDGSSAHGILATTIYLQRN